MKIYQASVKTPFAHLGLYFKGRHLAAVDFITAEHEIDARDPRAARLCRQIKQYINNPKAGIRFDVPCALQGTPFQKKVWNELRKIPPGQVVTYGELANTLGTSARAIGNACRKNPAPVVIPCHRVVAADGIGGYAGETDGDLLQVKSWLLAHEGAAINRNA